MPPLSRNPLTIAAVINLATESITEATSYLSTLPHPIEPLEELISVIAVTSNLLSALQTAIDRYPDLEFSPDLSFLNPLSHDIVYAISQLNGRVEDAKRSKIFQPNDVGLVRLPRNAWILINGTEAKAASLRSRLYVEKYRVRVLLDAVNWYGLRSLEIRDMDEEREFQNVRARLGLVAERLVGVWKDYTPRLKDLENAEQNPRVGNPFSDLVEVERQRSLQRALQLQMMNQQAQALQQMQPPRYEASMEQGQALRAQKEVEQATQQQQQQQQQMQPENTTPASPTNNDEKQALKRTNSGISCSSTTTIHPDTKYETYLLRRNPPTSTLKTSTITHLLGIPILWSNTLTHAPATHYIKALPSSNTEITTFRTTSQGSLSAVQHESKLKKDILNMPDDAQWEVQKLIEGRETATSARNVKREWAVVGMVERCRRKVSHGGLRRGRWWERRSGIDKRDQTEWVLVLRGETVDRQERVLGGKNANPWEGKREVQGQQVVQQQQQQQSVLRHVEVRRTMSVEEAEARMDEMLRDMFKFEEHEAFEDESDDEEQDDEKFTVTN
ncbi:uncharacterized protein LY89DRAFT_311033 [Mollisia scopiformis]|uniref:Uncharacterized protein n=1 Tax=Mollisia scopiformis TaxID=149040 RepID=A0A194XRI9_MOLSC|nr:uncharacterized protein LY89DRAFT_311033 [Mollisia scopiformis]KUJ22808.1 hypothetical protein LY89DRAFT_311033 [Mollisia scopiformis]